MKKIARAATPGLAKRLGWNIKAVDMKEWDGIRLLVMRAALRAKFAPDSDEARYLLHTKDALLIEGNDWGDTFWGCTKSQNGYTRGANWLGHLLMARRAELLGLIPLDADLRLQV